MANHSSMLVREPMTSMKMQKDMTLEDKTSRMEGVQYATGEEQRAITNTPERRKQLGQCGHDA